MQSDIPDRFDGARAWSSCRRLARPRAPGTEGERRTRADLLHSLREAGLSVWEDEFAYEGRVARLYPELTAFMALVGFSSMAVALAARSPYALVPAAILAEVVLARVLAGPVRLFLSRRLRRRATGANVCASTRCASPSNRIVLVAHYDGIAYRFPVWVTLPAMAAGQVAGLVVLHHTWLLWPFLAGSSPFALPVSWWAWLALGIASSLILVFNGEVPGEGALDNAAGCATLLEVARVVAQAPPERCEVLFLFTAAEEVGLHGMRRWIESLGSGPPALPTEILNLDIPFGPDGTISLTTGFGLLPRRTTSPALNALVLECAKRLSIPVRPFQVYLGFSADHRLAVEANLEATGFLARFLRVHHPSDSFDRVPASAFGPLGRLVLEVLVQLDAGANA